MASLAKRVRVRLLALAVVIGIVLGVGVLGVQQRARSAPASGADPNADVVAKVAVIQGVTDARNRGDEDAAAALFADNVFYIGTGAAACSLQTPCYDRAAVHASISEADAAYPNRCYTLTEVQVAGNIVTGRTDVRGDPTRAIGIERVMIPFMADVVDGKIVWMVQRQDMGDPQTALAAAIRAGTAPRGTPLPTPDPPCG